MPSYRPPVDDGKRKPDTVIFFDWDDTLIPSSFLSGKGYRLDTEAGALKEMEGALKELEQCVCSVLRLAMEFGQVHVVTNAETGWVQLSAQKFLPGVLPLLERVHIISARSTYEPMFPDSPLKWKFYAFQQKLSSYYSNTDDKGEISKNILSFGDSHVEREAVRAVTRGLPNTTTKSVKFAERPSLEQLRRQIELVTSCFQYIHHHQGDLDLQLTVTVNTNNGGEQGDSSNGTNNNPTSPSMSSLSAPPEEDGEGDEDESMEAPADSQQQAPQTPPRSAVSCGREDMDTSLDHNVSEEVEVA